MKFLCLTTLALTGLLSFAQAQTNKPAASKTNTSSNDQTNDDEQWLFDKYYGYVKEEAKKGKDVMAGEDAVKLADYLNTNPELKAKKAKIYRQGYTRKNQYKPQAGMSDRIMLLVGIPEPKNPAAALQADPRENEKYLEKIERLKEQAEEEARKVANSTDLMKTHKREGEAGVKKMYEDKADQSEIVRDMGGAKALQNMSEKERQEAAKKMVAKQTGGYTAEQIQKMTPAQRQALAMQMANNKATNGNDGAAAFTKMLMADPGYRAAYEKLSNTEKQKVYQEFLQNNNLQPTMPNDTKEMKEDEQDAREAIEIEKIAEQFRKELKELFDPIAQLEKQYVKDIEENRQELSRWVETETEKLPTVRDSEYGPRKDGIERVIFMQAVLSFAIGKDQVAKEQEIWDRYLDAYYTAFTKLDNWTARYEKRNDLSDRLKFQLAQLKIAGFEEVISMNKKAGYITGVAGSVQYGYNCQALRDCHDPRQDKYSAGK